MQNDFSVKKTKVTPEKILILKFSDSEKLFQKIEKLYSLPHFRNIKSDLYLLNGAYFLILHLKMPQKSVVKGFSEKILYCRILEYGKNICLSNAVLRVGKALAKEP